MSAPRPPTLRQAPEFVKLWAAQTVSLFGSQVTGLALPLTAAVTLHASAAQMGVLGAAEYLPFLLIGLVAGVWVDRLRRRPLMVVADLGRAVILGCVPIAALAHVLRIEYLYAVAFLAGVLTVFFDVAYTSFLPALIERTQLVEGNSKLEGSAATAQLTGPGIAGVLVQLVTGPLAIAVDAVSFLLSAVLVGAIRITEPAPGSRTQGQHLWGELTAGLRLLLGHPLTRPVAVGAAMGALFSNVAGAVFVLYATRALHLGPALLGLVFLAGGAGAILGAVLCARLARRWQVGRSIVGGLVLAYVPRLLVPFVGGPQAVVVATLMGVQFVSGLAFIVWDINQLTLRQAVTPDRALGRLNASFRFLVWGAIPIGSLVGGWLGTTLGLQAALLIGSGGALLAPVWIGFSPVRALREHPSLPGDVTVELAPDTPPVA